MSFDAYRGYGLLGWEPLSLDASSTVKSYVRLYYAVRKVAAEVKGSLRLLEARYWDLLLRFYAEEMRGRFREAEGLMAELDSLRRLAEEYLYLEEMLFSLSTIMEDVSPQDLSNPRPLLRLVRDVVVEALRTAGKVSAVLAVELGGIKDVLEALGSGGGSEDVGTVLENARKRAEAEVERRLPKPLLLLEGVSSLA